MYKKGLVYKKSLIFNWCPDCSTVLANEQVEQGKCWRHGKTDVIQKELSQWYFKITKYAQELLDDHEKLKNHWPSQVLTMQKNWIGRSSGAGVNLKLTGRCNCFYNKTRYNFWSYIYCNGSRTWISSK